jgi:hypothetical protein
MYDTKRNFKLTYSGRSEQAGEILIDEYTSDAFLEFRLDVDHQNQP